MIRYSVFGLLYTRTCPLSCRHCIIESSPKATDKMTPAMALSYIQVIPKYSDTVCITGGEPMLYYNEILPLIREAKRLGLLVSMVTGAGWVSLNKPEIARERMLGLKEAGLDNLLISWDDYHEEFSPAENALLLIEFCKEIGLAHHVRGVIPAFGPNPKIEQKLVTIDVRYEKVGIMRLGTATLLPEDHFQFSEETRRGGCSTALQGVVEPDGMVYACCGPSRYSKKTSPLVLGNTNDENLDTILHRAVRDPLIQAISSVGPYGLLQLIKQDPTLQNVLPVRERYIGICDLCLDLTNLPVIVQRLRERLSEPEIRVALTAAHLYSRAGSDLRQLAPPMLGAPAYSPTDVQEMYSTVHPTDSL